MHKIKSLKLIFVPILLVFLLAIYSLINKTSSNLLLTAKDNKFNVNFQLSQADKSQAELFLQQADLPKNVLDGFEFTLDGTSSAKLAYISPVKTNLKFQKNKVQFEGETTASIASSSSKLTQNFKAPSSPTISIFGQNLAQILEKKITQEDFKKWLATNLKNSTGQYLFIFGESPDIALIFKKDFDPDFDKLQSLKLSEDGYKQETQDNITFHFAENYVFFEIEDNIFVTSSFESAKNLASTQKGSLIKQNVFALETDLSFAAILENNPENKAESALKLLVGDEQKIISYFEKIENAKFFLKDNKFEGTIELIDSK